MEQSKPFKNYRAYIWHETFAVIKSKNIYRKAFANIADKNEITVIAELSSVNAEDIIEAEDGWKIITFDTVLPFTMVGFLAKVSTALANAGISIFAVSAFSRDHILIKTIKVEDAVERLENLGFVFEDKSVLTPSSAGQNFC